MSKKPINWRRLFFVLIPIIAVPLYYLRPSFLKTVIILAVCITFLLGFFKKDNPLKRPTNWRRYFLYALPFAYISVNHMFLDWFKVVLVIFVALIYLLAFLGGRWFTSHVTIKRYINILPTLSDQKEALSIIFRTRYMGNTEQKILSGLAMDAFEAFEAKYDTDIIYSLPNIIFFCMLIDANRIITYEGPAVVYMKIWNDVSRYPSLLPKCSHAESENVVSEMQKEYVGLVEFYPWDLMNILG